MTTQLKQEHSPVTYLAEIKKAMSAAATKNQRCREYWGFQSLIEHIQLLPEQDRDYGYSHHPKFGHCLVALMQIGKSNSSHMFVIQDNSGQDAQWAIHGGNDTYFHSPICSSLDS